MSLEQWSAVDQFIQVSLLENDPTLDSALAKSDEAGLPQIAVAPNQGKFLWLLARLLNARNVLELGTLGGYSTIWLARGLSAHGRLISLELNPKHAEVASENLRRAGVADRVEIRVGPALEQLSRLLEDKSGPFDLVFIDADKQNLPRYFDAAIALTRPGGLIVVDNVVRRGAIVDAASTDPNVQGVRLLYERLQTDRRVSATALQTVGSKGHDGLLLALVLP